jgi:hypothetical protein
MNSAISAAEYLTLRPILMNLSGYRLELAHTLNVWLFKPSSSAASALDNRRSILVSNAFTSDDFNPYSSY